MSRMQQPPSSLFSPTSEERSAAARSRDFPSVSWPVDATVDIGKSGAIYYDVTSHATDPERKWVRQIAEGDQKPTFQSTEIVQLTPRLRHLMYLQDERRVQARIDYEVESAINFFQIKYRDVYVPAELLNNALTESLSIGRRQQRANGNSQIQASQGNLLGYYEHRNYQCLVYPVDELGNELAFHEFVRCEEGTAEVGAKEEMRSTVKLRTPIRQVNIGKQMGDEPALVTVRSFGGVTVMCPKISATEEGPMEYQYPKWLVNLPTTKPPLDVASSPFLRGEIAVCGESGFVGLWDAPEDSKLKIVHQTNLEILGNDGFDRWMACGWGAHPRCLYIATRKSAELIDFRIPSSTSVNTLAAAPKSVLFGIQPHPDDAFHVVATTDSQILLYDQRHLRRPLLSWNHHQEREPPVGTLPVRLSGEFKDTDVIMTWNRRSAQPLLYTYTDSATKLQTTLSHPFRIPSHRDHPTYRTTSRNLPHPDLSRTRAIQPTDVWPSRYPPLVGFTCNAVPHGNESRNAQLTVWQMAETGAVYQTRLELGHGISQPEPKEKRPRVEDVNGLNQVSTVDTGRSENVEELERRRRDFINFAEWLLDFDKGAWEFPEDDLKKFRRIDMSDVYQDFNRMLRNIKTGIKGKKRSRSQIEDRLTARSAKSPHPFSVAEVLTGTTYKQHYLQQCTEIATDHVRKMQSDGGLHGYGHVWTTLRIANQLAGYDIGEYKQEMDNEAFPNSDPALVMAFVRILTCSSTVIKPSTGSAHDDTEMIDTQATTQSGWTVPVGSQLENEYGVRKVVPSKVTDFKPSVRALMDRWDFPAGVVDEDESIYVTEDDFPPSQSTSITFPDSQFSQSQSFSHHPSNSLSQDFSQSSFERPSSQFVSQPFSTPAQTPRGIESRNVASALRRESQYSQDFSQFSSNVLPSQASVPMDFRYGAEEDEDEETQVASSLYIPQIQIVSSQPTQLEFTQTPKGTKKKKKGKDRMSGF